MKVIIQRVLESKVIVEGQCVGEIQRGLMVLVGFKHEEDPELIEFMADKVVNLRIFEDTEDKMNLSVNDIGGNILLVPNFTLYADARKGRRPNFVNAARPEEAEPLFNQLFEAINRMLPGTQKGVFRADMKVHLINDGPVTIEIEK